MVPIESILPYVAFLAVLVAFTVFTMLWVHLSGIGMAYAARAVVRLGLYDPGEPSGREPTVGKKDRSVHLFTGAVRWVSSFVPGNPRTDPLPIIVPMIVVGMPAFFGLVFLLMALPLISAWFVASLGPSSLVLPLGLLGLLGYYAAFLLGMNLWQRLPELREQRLTFAV